LVRWKNKGMFFVLFAFVLGLSFFGSFHLCRMTRINNFWWKKPLRH
jgi:hypothetical protein